MSDILSQGPDREPRPWRRRLVVLAALAGLAAAGVVVSLPRHHSPRPYRAPPVPVVAGPDGITGPSVPWDAGLRLPVAGVRPALLAPAAGRRQVIGGLPVSRAGYQFTQVAGGWAIQASVAGAAQRAVCDTCAGAPRPVYFLPERGRTATLVAPADAVAPAAGRRVMWLTVYPPDVSPRRAAGVARPVDRAGTAAGPTVRLPAGYQIVRGTVAGLLLARGPGATADELWDPATGRSRPVAAGLMAASASRLAFAPACATACSVSVLDLASGRVTAVRLPRASSVARAAFSSDGGYLAVQVSSSAGGDAGGLATRLEVAATRTGRLMMMPQTSLSSDALIGFGWPPGRDRLVAELSFTTKVQLASWQPGTPRLAVAVLAPARGPGRDPGVIVTG